MVSIDSSPAKRIVAVSQTSLDQPLVYILLLVVLAFASGRLSALVDPTPNHPTHHDGDASPNSHAPPSLEQQVERPPLEQSIVDELYEHVTAGRLRKIAIEHKVAYSHASPFPHIAIDGIFPARFLAAVLQENPESIMVNDCVASKKCFKGDPKQNKKSAIDSEEDMGMHTRILLALMKSSTFVQFLEQLTGISNIIPDPHYRGSGLHFTASGGNLNVHADFNKHVTYKLDRRVNAFLYLNPDWPEEYGGHLELWSRDMKACHERILPSLGRFVVFSSTDFSYHGHPTPLAAPKGRARRSIALYYYTNDRPQGECLKNDCSGNGHSTLFQEPQGCRKCEEVACRRYRDDVRIPNWLKRL